MVKDILEISTKNFLVDYTLLHIYDDSSCFEVIYSRPTLQVNLAMLFVVNIPEERAQSLIVDQRLVVLTMLSECKLPESKAQLIPALSYLYSDDFSWHYF